MKSTALVALGLAAVVSAQASDTTYTDTTSLPAIYPTEGPTDTVITVTFQSSIYTIPVWNPTTALTYGDPGTTLPTDGPNQPSPSTSCTKSHSKSPSSSSSSPPSPSVSAPASEPSSKSPAASTTPPPSSSSSTSAAPVQQSTGAAHAVSPEVVGALVGGIAAGWALV